MQDNHSNLEEQQSAEEPFQIEEGLSANVLNNMMEETLIRDSDGDSNQDTKSNEIKSEISEINEEKLDQFRHQITNALEQFWTTEFSDKTSLKFLSQELLQYKDFQQNNDQPSSVSFLSLKEFGTVWIFQMESDQALKLASIFRARRQELDSKVELSEHLDGSLKLPSRIFLNYFTGKFSNNRSRKNSNSGICCVLHSIARLTMENFCYFWNLGRRIRIKKGQ